jgi:hypothetical protein
MDEVFWTIVTFAFVVLTLATVAFGIARMFGFFGGPYRPQH